MEFLALGPLEVRVGGRALELGGPRQRAVLAALLARANALATVEYLVDAVWETSPATPESNLRSYVAVLRKQFGAESGRLVTRPGGYLVVVEPGELDLAEFAELAERGRAAQDPRESAETLRRALALWRGRPFEGVTGGPGLGTEATSLDEQYHGVVADYLLARFSLGEHAEVVPELRRLTTSHPLREQLWASLMTALHHTGRRAEALSVFRQVRKVLDEELGIAPGAELQQVHAQVLADPQPMPAPQRRGPARQLPPAVDHFTGRQEELGEVVELLEGERERLAVVTISGSPGVGKSALAIAAAHRLCASYPDGQLFVDLAGAGGQPRDAGDVLARFLRDLGVPGVDIPVAIEERAALFRDRIARRRMLVVLDNAANDAQVRPLLPGSKLCGVIVTSRRRLAGLDVSLRVQLAELPHADAVGLLGSLAGAAGVDSAAAARIVRSCGNLPLAVRIVGTKLRALPHLSATAMAARLDDERHRLDELVSGDREVRAGFLVSYEQLGADQQRGFRLLALLPGPDFGAWAAACATGAGLRAAERLIDGLVEANLVECVSPDRQRFRFHDLIRLIATEQVEAAAVAAEREEALDRILLTHLQLGQRADAALAFGGLHRFSLPPPAPYLAELVRDAPGWFDDEADNLIAAVETAARGGRHLTTCRLSATLIAYLELRGRWNEIVCVSQLSLIAAEALNSPYWTAYAYFALGLAARERHDVEPAQRYFGLCLQALPAADDPRLEMVTLLAIGVGLRFLGRYEEATESFRSGLARLSTSDEPHWVAYTKRELAVIHRYRGERETAQAYLNDAADEFVLLGDRRWEAACLRELGVIARDNGDHPAALKLLGTARDIFASLGDARREGAAWRSLAYTHRAMGDIPAAETCCRRSREVFARTLDAHGAACTQVLHAELVAARGETGNALRHLHGALATFRASGDPRWTGKALLTLGDVLAAAGDSEQAVQVRQEGTGLLTGIGAVEARRVAAS